MDITSKTSSFNKPLHKLDISQVNTEEITLSINIDLPFGYTIFDVFDDIKTSKSLPFIHLRYNKRELFKIYEEGMFEKGWEDILQTDGILFKTFDNKQYCNCTLVWGENKDIIEVDMDVRKGGLKEVLVETIKKGILLPVKSIKQLHVKSTFDIKIPEKHTGFNKVIFADMIETDPLFIKYTFVNDYVDFFTVHKTATIITKDRFGFYFKQKNDYDKKDALYITITPYEFEAAVRIRAARVQNEGMLSDFMNIFSKLFIHYLEKEKEIKDVYVNIIGKDGIKMISNEKYEQKFKREKRDRKTGERLSKLQAEHPDVFGRIGYSTECQKSNQPYIVHQDEINSKKKFFEENYKLIKPDALMMKYKYTNSKTGKDTEFTFACAPREDGSSNIFPVVKNPKKGTESAIIVPCCAKKKAKDKKVKKVEIGYIKTYKTYLDEGHYGTVPFYLEQFIKSSGYNKYDYKGKQYYPFLRYGVATSPNTFLLCMERAFGNDYSVLSIEAREKRAMKKRKQMAMMNLALIKQHFPFESDEYIKDLLLNGGYLDPDLFKELVEECYGCVIHIFKRDDKNPYGEVSRHSSKYPFLEECTLSSRKHVIICKFEITNSLIPYKCDLIVKHHPPPDIFTFSSTEPFIREIIDIEKDANKVYFVSQEGIWNYGC